MLQNVTTVFMIKSASFIVLESKEETLSLEERMHLILNDFGKLISYIILISMAVFLFSGLALYEITTIDNYLNSLDFDFPNVDDESIYYHVGQVQSYTVISIAVVVIAMVWFASRGRKIIKELNFLQKEKIRQSYYLTFETSVPIGQTPIERILYMIRSIFPEIKVAERKRQKKGKKLYDVEKRIKDYVYDLVIYTGEGPLLVEFFNKKLGFEDLKDFVKKTNNAFEKVKLLRVLCVAKEYDEIFYKDEIVPKMKDLNRRFKLDLIVAEGDSYSMLWLD